MEKYRKSILEYHDVRSAMDCALEDGIKKGRKEGIEIGREEEKIAAIKKYFQKNMSIEDIVFFTGFSKEQINRYKMSGTL